MENTQHKNVQYNEMVYNNTFNMYDNHVNNNKERKNKQEFSLAFYMPITTLQDVIHLKELTKEIKRKTPEKQIILFN